MPKRNPGVIAVYTCDNIGRLDTELPLLIPHESMTDARTQRPLARDDVYYVGQTVAMIVAVDRYTAEDAALLVEVDYDPMDVELELEEAIKADAPLVHATHPNNIAADFVQVCGDPDSGFAEAEHVTRIRIQVDRSTAAAMECRAVAARFDGVTGELTVWDSTQAPISVRGGLASILQIDEDKVRVIAPDVGGGFGQKVLLFYPDELLVPFASMQLGCSVKYVEDRRENFIGSTQERTQIHHIELHAKKTGEVVALKDFFMHDTVHSSPMASPYRRWPRRRLPGRTRSPISMSISRPCTRRLSRSRPIAVAVVRSPALPSREPWISWPTILGWIGSKSAGST